MRRPNNITTIEMFVTKHYIHLETYLDAAEPGTRPSADNFANVFQIDRHVNRTKSFVGGRSAGIQAVWTGPPAEPAEV